MTEVITYVSVIWEVDVDLITWVCVLLMTEVVTSVSVICEVDVVTVVAVVIVVDVSVK